MSEQRTPPTLGTAPAPTGDLARELREEYHRALVAQVNRPDFVMQALFPGMRS